MKAAQLESLLAQAFPAARVIRHLDARAHWSLAQVNGPAIDVRDEGDWLVFERPLPRTRSAEAPARPDALHAKPIGAGNMHRLRAELPLVDSTASARVWLVRQMQDAVAALGRGALPADESPQAVDPATLAEMFAGTGWQANVKRDGTVRLHHNIRGVPRAIDLRADTCGLRATLLLDASLIAGASETSRAAVQALIARADAALRWVRAFLVDSAEHEPAIGFACAVAAPVDPGAALCAVDALAAACEAFGAEAELLLQQPALAALYLASTRARDDDTVDAPHEHESENGAAAPRPVPSHPAALPALA